MVSVGPDVKPALAQQLVVDTSMPGEGPSAELLESELPMVMDGQVPLRDIITRITQEIYADLINQSETLGSQDEVQRKRQICSFVIQAKRQIVKLLAIVKWARDAHDVQKSMNITAFLMDQNQQFTQVVGAIDAVREGLKATRLRNHDILTSLDVLSTGTYQRLPRALKDPFIPPAPFTNPQVTKTMSDFEDLMQFRLQMDEILPAEMQNYRISDGRVAFLVPDQFEVAVCLLGARPEDGWFFVSAEFQMNVLGDATVTQEFPRVPPTHLKNLITDEANGRMGLYVPLPVDPNIPPELQPPRPKLPDGVTDAPLVRLYNFMHMMSLTYHLEILAHQAGRLRSLGWAEHLRIEMSNDRRTLTASYWLRKPPAIKHPARSAYLAARNPLPLLGGKLIIAVEPRPRDRSNSLVWEMGLRGRKPSEEPESFGMNVRWEPAKGAWGIDALASPATLVLGVDPQQLDFEALLLRVLRAHAREVVQKIYFDLLAHVPPLSMPGVMTLHEQSLDLAGALELRYNFMGPELAQDGSAMGDPHAEALIMTLDLRTGQIGMREESQLSGRAVHVHSACTFINDDPIHLASAILRLRMDTILEDVQKKALALGLRCHDRRPVSMEDLQRFGRSYDRRWIQLSQFSEYYLVVVLGEEGFRFALTETRGLVVKPSGTSGDAALGVGANPPPTMRITDSGWLQPEGIGLEGVASIVPGRFRLTPEQIKELYAYCCARVSYKLVELQLRAKAIPYRSILSQLNAPQHAAVAEAAALGVAGPAVLATQFQAHVPFARAIPVLVVDSELILAGVPAAEAAMPNIQITPLHWWSAQKCQVVTSVKLKYVQPPVGPAMNTPTPLPTPGPSTGAGVNTTPGRPKRVRPPPPRIMRPSDSIVYDTQEAVVSFVSDNVQTCVEEFLDQWAKVSRMVIVAREVTTMAKEREWTDVRLLSFDLQTVEFAYAAGYAVTINCTGDLLSAGPGTYSLRFRAFGPVAAREGGCDPEDEDAERPNPHADMASLLENKMCSSGVRILVELLRASLPVVLELERIRAESWVSDISGTRASPVMDVVAKSCSWFRVLYSGRRALDVRLLDDHAMLVDGAHSVSAPGPSAEKDGPSGSTARAGSGTGTTAEPAGWLRPISGLRDICVNVVRESAAASKDRGNAISASPNRDTRRLSAGTRREQSRTAARVALLDHGLVCPREDVRTILRAVHGQLRDALAAAGPDG
ncbi:MED14-domain-containing protein [Auriculariales sp. MPI-PUGE-AT-0066]|nr:MED14-domain-containing protein [Auriculariales sp. MPI-PUGE-AT-0066]